MEYLGDESGMKASMGICGHDCESAINKLQETLAVGELAVHNQLIHATCDVHRVLLKLEMFRFIDYNYN